MPDTPPNPEPPSLDRRASDPTDEGAGRPGSGLVASVDRIDGIIDAWWDRNLRGHPGLDRLFYTASEAADHSILWHGLGVTRALMCRRPRFALQLSSALGLESALVNGPVKWAFRRSRPPPRGPRPHRLRQPRTTSFPSGHASAAMVAASLLSRGSRWWGPGWYGLAGLVALSRIHVRIHHASDVAAGLAVGAVLGTLARRILS